MHSFIFACVRLHVHACIHKYEYIIESKHGCIFLLQLRNGEVVGDLKPDFVLDSIQSVITGDGVDVIA